MYFLGEGMTYAPPFFFVVKISSELINQSITSHILKLLGLFPSIFEATGKMLRTLKSDVQGVEISHNYRCRYETSHGKPIHLLRGLT